MFESILYLALEIKLIKFLNKDHPGIPSSNPKLSSEVGQSMARDGACSDVTPNHTQRLTVTLTRRVELWTCPFQSHRFNGLISLAFWLIFCCRLQQSHLAHFSLLRTLFPTLTAHLSRHSRAFSSMASPSSALNKSSMVQQGRIRVLKEGSTPSGRDAGPVVYWMFRDQRLRDNWALIHAVDQANKANVPVAIAFNLFDQFLGAKARQLGFMLRGLRLLHRDLEQTLQIPFFLFQAYTFEILASLLDSHSVWLPGNWEK